MIERFAERLPRPQRKRLLEDASTAVVLAATADGSRITFHIPGYERPTYQGQYSFPVEGRVQDKDGAILSVVLFADAEDRLYELEIIRFDPGPVIKPDWSTLQVVG